MGLGPRLRLSPTSCAPKRPAPLLEVPAPSLQVVPGAEGPASSSRPRPSANGPCPFVRSPAPPTARRGGAETLEPLWAPPPKPHFRAPARPASPRPPTVTMERQVRARPAVPVVFAARAGPDTSVSPAQVLLSEPEEAAALYRGLSRQPALSAACLGPEVTTQYGGRYRTVHTGVCVEGNPVAGPLGWRGGGCAGPDTCQCTRVCEGRRVLERMRVEGCTPPEVCAHRCVGVGLYTVLRVSWDGSHECMS